MKILVIFKVPFKAPLLKWYQWNLVWDWYFVFKLELWNFGSYTFLPVLLLLWMVWIQQTQNALDENSQIWNTSCHGSKIKVTDWPWYKWCACYEDIGRMCFHVWQHILVLFVIMWKTNILFGNLQITILWLPLLWTVFQTFLSPILGKAFS